MSGETLVWLDGQPSTALPLPDRGLEFGDGLFETLLVRDGAALYRDAHLLRLQRGIAALYFPACLPFVERCLQVACDDIHGRGPGWMALRLTLTRGSAPRGYAPPPECTPRVLIQAVPLARDPAQMMPPASLGRATIALASQPALAGLKHLNRLEQVLAAREAREQGVDEVVLCGQAGQVVGVAAGNLFLLLDDTLVTPPVDACGVAGTRRALLMERWAPTAGVSVREATVSLDDLARAREVFFSNALIGLRPVERIGDQRWVEHQLCNTLFGIYRGDAA